MRATPNPKTMAKTLRAALSERHMDIPHSVALEIVATQFGLESWNILAASLKGVAPTGGIGFKGASPIMRIFDEAKAKEFYLGFLGFNLDWENRFGDNFPLYAQVSRAGLTVHLSEHHGDASPGSTVFVDMEGVHAYQQELVRKRYTYGNPGIEDLPWGRMMTVTDPFSNRIRFCEGKPGS